MRQKQGVYRAGSMRLQARKDEAKKKNLVKNGTECWWHVILVFPTNTAVCAPSIQRKLLNGTRTHTYWRNTVPYRASSFFERGEKLKFWSQNIQFLSFTLGPPRLAVVSKCEARKIKWCRWGIGFLLQFPGRWVGFRVRRSGGCGYYYIPVNPVLLPELPVQLH